jgi:hypothetical protein
VWLWQQKGSGGSLNLRTGSKKRVNASLDALQRMNFPFSSASSGHGIQATVGIFGCPEVDINGQRGCDGGYKLDISIFSDISWSRVFL